MKRVGFLLALVSMVMVVAACGQKVTDTVYEKVEVAQTTVEDAIQSEVKDTVQEDVAELVQAEEKELGDVLLLATTTSTRDSGLLDYILGDFTEQSGIEVKVIAVGTGKALQMGRDGEADCLLVHAKASEEEFVTEGYGTVRYDVMYNDFIIVGPTEDPAGLKNGAVSDVVEGLKLVDASESKFLTRGDDSGTNKKEISLWKAATIDIDSKPYYLSTGKGMGDTLGMTSEMQAYTMTDRATYLNMRENLELDIVLEGDALMFNQYGVIPVNPETNELINHAEALVFIDWLLSDDTQAMIGVYGVDRFGTPLFTPNATK